MANHFIAVVGKRKSGKTHALNKFIEETKGVYFSERIKAICSFNQRTIFVITSSPQERSSIKNNRRTSVVLKEDLAFFEKLATEHKIRDYVILMPFSILSNRRSNEVWDEPAQIIEQNYTLHRIDNPHNGEDTITVEHLNQKVKETVQKIKSLILQF